MSRIITSYKDLLNNSYVDRSLENEYKIAYFLQRLKKLPESAFQEIIYFAIDYRKKKYIFIDGDIEKSLGLKKPDFLSSGIENLLELFHKDDFNVFDKNIFKIFVDSMTSIPSKEIEKYIFSYNFRIKHKDGSYHTVLQKGKYILDPETMMPIYCYGTVSDITLFKKDNGIVQMIDKCTPGQGGNTLTNILTNTFFPIPEESKLELIEKEILNWTIEGLKTSEIAERLHIKNTKIHEYRTNIMRKTNSKNTAQLVRFAIENGLI